MVGGTIVGTSFNKDKKEMLINVEDSTGYRLAIRVKLPDHLRPMLEDQIWWQGNKAMWTPKENDTSGKCGKDFDIQLERIGYSH